jgi:hypothetical protein
VPAFDIPVNLPHAATLARRLRTRLAAKLEGLSDIEALRDLADELLDALVEYEGGQDPAEPEELEAVERAAEVARRLVDEIERLGAGDDRIGQTVRNVFECLGLGAEGADISLRAGESPTSLMRPL